MNKLFSFNPDITCNAYMNWRTDKNDQGHNLYVLASDYADGAMILINQVLRDNSDKKADALIMPIMFCIDHAIEVYIKAIKRTLEILNGTEPVNKLSHNIKCLLSEMTDAIKSNGLMSAEDKKQLEEYLSPVSEFINELFVEIQSTNNKGNKKNYIDFARYPITSEGYPHFYVSSEEIVVIDVENLKGRFSEIRNCLESLYLMYKNESDVREDKT